MVALQELILHFLFIIFTPYQKFVYNTNQGDINYEVFY